MGIVRTLISLTRPANVTAYAANDAISDATSSPADITAANLGPGYLVGLKVITNNAASMTPRLRLHFFRNTAPTQIADNAPCTAPLDADAANKYAGFITMPAMTSGGSGADSAYTEDMGLRFPLDADTYFFIVQTLDAVTPASNQIFRFVFFTERAK